ncbi:MAG: CPBP family intramembrane metalloprotease [Clostridia bacterium]|nr:CPBP family intramembrane metalloprotease [Clostridia bacterium]
MEPFPVYDRTAARRAARRSGNIAGLFVLTALVLSFLCGLFIPLLLSFFGKIDLNADRFGLSQTGYDLLNMALYIFFLSPSILLGLLLRRPFPLLRSQNRPMPRRVLLPAILAGMGVCMTANLLANAVYSFFTNIGINPYSPEPATLTWPGLLIALLSVVVLPALLEELLFRGYVLQVLRPHGELNALLLSSLLFGLLHGNVIQIPFAFVSGLAFGYLTLRTGNIWAGVLLHALNNAYATLSDYGPLFFRDENLQNGYSTVLYVLMLLAGCVSVWYLYSRTDFFNGLSNNSGPVLSAGERTKAVWSAPMVIVTLAMLTLYAIYVAASTWEPAQLNLLPLAGLLRGYGLC